MEVIQQQLAALLVPISHCIRHLTLISLTLRNFIHLSPFNTTAFSELRSVHEESGPTLRSISLKPSPSYPRFIGHRLGRGLHSKFSTPPGATIVAEPADVGYCHSVSQLAKSAIRLLCPSKIIYLVAKHSSSHSSRTLPSTLSSTIPPTSKPL